MLFIFLDNSCSSSSLAPVSEDFIDVKLLIFFDINVIFSLALDIKSEKFSRESFPLFDELSDIIISSSFGIGIPFCFAICKIKGLY